MRRQAHGPLTVGERFQEVHAAMGRRLESTVEVVEHRAPSAFATRIVDGPVPLDGRWTFEPTGGATRLHFVGEGDVSGPMRLARPLLARQFRGYHKRLKALLEQDA